MDKIWKQSRGAARPALVLGGVALSIFAFPFIWTHVFGLYAGVFVFMYLVFAVPATVFAVIADRQNQWWRPDGVKRFMGALYGLPFLLLLLAGWMMTR